MTDAVDAATSTFEDHDAFTRESTTPNDITFTVSSTPFDALVEIDPAASGVLYRVTVRLPAINAVVRGEEVAPVVQDGWFETFTRRTTDMTGVIRGDGLTPEVRLDAAETVVVETEFTTDDPRHAAADAKAVIDYVEGTYVQGIIPGYDYRDPAASLLHRAQRNANQTSRSESP